MLSKSRLTVESFQFIACVIRIKPLGFVVVKADVVGFLCDIIKSALVEFPSINNQVWGFFLLLSEKLLAD